MRRKIIVAALGLTLTLLLGGCGGVDTSQVTANAVVPLQDASLQKAESKRLVGIGEATHGNKELVETRKLIIKNLVGMHGFRTVALEADFGGSATANDYVLHDRGTAEDAAKALGFDIYKTKETADLLQWIHDHNAKAAAADQVWLYGFDMQRYDQNKIWLLKFLKEVDPKQVPAIEKVLSGLTDANRVEAEEATKKAGLRAAQDVLTSLQTAKKRYVKASSATAYALAEHHAATIVKCAQLQTAGNDFAKKRDAWMAENVQWLSAFEADHGRQKMILGGHNGHIEKSGAAFAFPSMGQQLAQAYGKDYFTIGTEFEKNTFSSLDAGSGQRATFTLDNDTPLAKLFGDEPLGYVDIAEASKEPANRTLLESEIKMGSVGDSFRSIYRLVGLTYKVKMVPAESYDALVLAPAATPVTPL